MTDVRDKDAVRRAARASLATMGESTYQEKSTLICSRLTGLQIWDQASTIHSFWPVTERCEPDIRPFLRLLLSDGKRLVLPVITSFSKHTGSQPRLKHIEVTNVDDLIENRWRIPEPRTGPEIRVSELDVIVVPALAVDGHGNRVGGGMGYYDEFLAELQIPRVCPVFSVSCFETVPTEPHDVRMTYIVTESDLLDLSGM